MKKIITIVILLQVSCAIYAVTKNTRISTHKQLDEAIELINNGHEMHLALSPGRYVLKKSIKANAPLSIKGNRTIITCCVDSFISNYSAKNTKSHFVYKLKQSLSIFPLFYDERGNILKVSESVIGNSRVNFVEGDIVSTGNFYPGSSLIIPISSNLGRLKNKVFDFAFGYIDSGWGVVNLKLEKSDEKFFYCTTQNICLTRNFQYDKSTYNRKVRFVIFNAEVTDDGIYYDKEWLYVPKCMKRVYCLNRNDKNHSYPVVTTKSDVKLQGLQFQGFCSINVESPADMVCEITDCFFQNSLDNALTITKNNGDGLRMAYLKKCRFESCALLNGYIVRLNSNYVGTPCILMKNCIVERYPNDEVMYKNSVGAVCSEADASIIGNVIKNTCRDHIFIGRGVNEVKGNFLYNSNRFNSYVYRNLSSDFGLIYCNHLFSKTQDALNNKSNRIRLEGNLFYGAYAYANDARGIFIDDGRGDVECYDNIILNSQRYSIDSRNISTHDASSVRNVYSGNIVTTKYRLEGGSAAKGLDSPVVKKNYIATEEKNTLMSVVVKEPDETLTGTFSFTLKEGKILVTKSLYESIKVNPSWKQIKPYIKKAKDQIISDNIVIH